MIRLAIVVLLLSASYAGAEEAASGIAPISPSNFLNYLLGACMTVVTTIFLPMAYLWASQKRAERELTIAKIKAETRAALDAGAQKSLGGALGNVDIPDGKITGALKEQVVAEASASLERNFSDVLSKSGATEKAREIIENRLGLMNAQAAGNPVPNPSQATPTPVPVPVPVPVKP